MNFYTITLHNKKQNLWKKEVIQKHTFPEAAMAANNTRNYLGFDWEITSIFKKIKEEKNA